jgi:cytochrome P450
MYAASPSSLPPSAPLPPTLQTFAFWADPHRYLQWCFARYGSRFTIRAVGKPPLIFLSDPQAISAILKAPPEMLYPGAGASVIAPLVGEGSFMLAEEQEHLTRRRTIMPAFHRQAIQQHAQSLTEIVQNEIADWPLHTPVAIHPALRALSLKVILFTVFGVDSARLRDLHAQLLSMLSVTGSLVLQEPQLRHLPGWRRIWRTFVAERAKVDKLIFDLIEAPRAGHAEGPLSMLLAGSTDRSETGIAEIRNDLMSIIVAGHETTASQLAWAFQLLAHNPTTMRRLIADLDRGYEQYLTATVYEVLRHRPVFLFAIPRSVNLPITIGGFSYRPPVHLVGCIHLLQHDPRHYSEPQLFRPERFLSHAPRPDLWLPWGGGRKRCPGQHLALLEMQTVLRVVLGQLEIRPVARVVEKARWRSVIVTPGSGSRVELVPRRGASRSQASCASRNLVS